VDSSSIEVNRRYRRAKTDRIDVTKLAGMLIRHVNGEQKLWSVLHIPTAAQEDNRRLNREADRLKKERTAHTNRIKSLLVLHGIRLRIGKGFEQALDRVVMYNGDKLAQRLKQEILREYQRYQLAQAQLKEITVEKAEVLEQDSPFAVKARALINLRSIGQVSSWDLTSEFFGWREFKNVKQVSAASGLAPTPYASGDLNREQGISKAGNPRVRKTMIELAWFWLRYQPQSQLSQWFFKRFGSGGARMRRIGIVALARKLLVALWKYLELGLVPEGAVLKSV
jgi:transposase